jgi:hypothetical protein
MLAATGNIASHFPGMFANSVGALRLTGRVTADPTPPANAVGSAAVSDDP